MPRRLPVRPAKVFGNLFVLLVLSVIALIYYTFVFVVWGPRADSKYHAPSIKLPAMNLNELDGRTINCFNRGITIFKLHLSSIPDLLL